MSEAAYNQRVQVLVGELHADDIRSEDGGCARIATLDPVGQGRLFVRIQSWDESEESPHPEFERLIEPGCRYRVTIERWETPNAG